MRPLQFEYNTFTVISPPFIHISCGKLIPIFIAMHRGDAHYPHFLFTSCPHYRLDASFRYILSTFLSTSYPLIPIEIFRFNLSTFGVENLSPFPHHDSCTVTLSMSYPHKMWKTYPHFYRSISRRYTLSTFSVDKFSTLFNTVDNFRTVFIMLKKLSIGHSEQKVDKLAKNVDKSSELWISASCSFPLFLIHNFCGKLIHITNALEISHRNFPHFVWISFPHLFGWGG